MTDAFRSMWNNGNGLWTNIGNGEGKYHAVCIVGYNDNTQMFKVQNSWGTNGGDNGFFWVSYNLVQSGVFLHAYVLTDITTDVYPTIVGPTKLCSSEQYALGSVPTGMSVTWGVVETMTSPYPLTYVSNGITAIYTRGTNSDGTLYVGTKTIKAIIYNGSASYTATKTINMPFTAKPSIDYKNHTINVVWPVNTSRTLEAFNINNASPSNLLWSVIMPQSTITNYYTGKTLTLTPPNSGTLTVTVTNQEGCSPNNSYTKTYNILSKLFIMLSKNDSGNIEGIIFEDANNSKDFDTLYIGEYYLEIVNEKLEKIYGEIRNEPITEIEMEKLRKGLYSIRLYVENELIDTQALIVK